MREDADDGDEDEDDDEGRQDEKYRKLSLQHANEI